MKKRGQISYFLILSISLVIVAGLVLYVKNIGVKKQTVEKSSESEDAGIVKSYAEACLKNLAEEALFKKVGIQGGYINPNGLLEVDNGKSRFNFESTLYHENFVPYYLEKTTINGRMDYYTFVPTLEQIQDKLGNYIAAEFENCFDIGVFADKGIEIITPTKESEIKAAVNANEEDVSINFRYPLIVKKGSVQTKLDLFLVTLPIRLKSIHDWASTLVENIKNKQPDEYDTSISCNFDKRGLTNIYLKEISNGKIIQFIDFSTYNEKYLKSFIFQFAVKDVNVKGNCVG